MDHFGTILAPKCEPQLSKLLTLPQDDPSSGLPPLFHRPLKRHKKGKNMFLDRIAFLPFVCPFLGPFWAHLGAFLGPSWAFLGPSWGALIINCCSHKIHHHMPLSLAAGNAFAMPVVGSVIQALILCTLAFPRLPILTHYILADSQPKLRSTVANHVAVQ